MDLSNVRIHQAVEDSVDLSFAPCRVMVARVLFDCVNRLLRLLRL